ncbi:unnamed protein product [Blepharisma stoltei]|uniref:histidine kinase n=1 Tax=Blepharisma stoltei TaxID=1481888 RepID=A0AAU9JDC0_9CILI|nr:unnamed protein product [Blepharisma stoltei]
MERLYYQWWDEEVNEKYQVIKRFSYLLWVIAVFFTILCLLLRSDTYMIIKFSMPWILVHSGQCYLICYLDKKSYLAKSIFSILFAEGNCACLWIQGNVLWKEVNILGQMLAFVYINSFELPFIQAWYNKTFVIAKHILVWNHFKYFTGEYEWFQLGFFAHLLAFLILFLYNLDSSFLKEKSYERFIAHHKLHCMQSRMSLIFNLFPDGIVILSYENDILYSNQNLKRLLKCRDSEEIINLLSNIEYCDGKKYANLSNSNKILDDIGNVQHLNLNQEIMLGLAKVDEYNLEWKAQKVIWEETEAVLLTVRDVNNLIQLEQTTADNKLKNVLLRSVSHELRTPINSISFFAEEVSRESCIANNKSLMQKLKVISVSSNLLLSLVNDLLDYSRMVAGVFSTQRSKFELFSTIESCIQLIKIQAEKKGIRVITRLDPQLPAYAFSDQLRLSQVLLNLLSNALKFTLKGQIDIACFLDIHHKLKISVKDTGIGIKKHKLKGLFKEFNTEISQNINPQGCGLGLFIANRIAKELGGESIKVKSKTNKGSKFDFSVYIAENMSDYEPIYEEVNPSLCENKRPYASIRNFDYLIESKKRAEILIADDNDLNRIILGTSLAAYNIIYDEACSGKEAVRLTFESDRRSKPYKLIIMDGSMPELNGWEASKMILDSYFQGEIKSLPAILGYTAFNSDDELKLCIESGMKEVITKPCSSELLIRTVFKYLS